MMDLDNYDEINVRENFEEIWKRYYRSMVNFAFNLVGDMPVAEDIASNCFVKLLQLNAEAPGNKKNSFTIKTVGHFLFKSTRNACIDWLRLQKNRRRQHTEFIEMFPLIDFENYANIFYDEMLKAKVLQAIYEQVETLPPIQKFVFKAVFIDHRTTADIARERNVTSQTILNLKAVLLNKLRDGIAKFIMQGLYIVISLHPFFL